MAHSFIAVFEALGWTSVWVKGEILRMRQHNHFRDGAQEPILLGKAAFVLQIHLIRNLNRPVRDMLFAELLVSQGWLRNLCKLSREMHD